MKRTLFWKLTFLASWYNKFVYWYPPKGQSSQGTMYKISKFFWCFCSWESEWLIHGAGYMMYVWIYIHEKLLIFGKCWWRNSSFQFMPKDIITLQNKQKFQITACKKTSKLSWWQIESWTLAHPYNVKLDNDSITFLK